MKFKVGDKVRFSKGMDGSAHGPYVENDDLVRSIIEINDNDIRLEGLCENWFRYFELELVNTTNFTKSDLQDGDILTDSEGCSSTYWKGRLHGTTISINSLNDDLEGNDGNSENNIVKVERPIKYETVFERKEEPKVREMTVEEISKELGYEVKVVK